MPSRALQPNRVSFQVAEVELGFERFSEITTRAALERTVRSPLVTFSQAPGKVVQAGDHEGRRHFFYVFGGDPERFDGLDLKESRAQIFRWDGGHTKESFEAVAHTFSEWLESMLDRARPDGPF